MNTSCAKSCDWIPDLPPGAAIAFTPRENFSCAETHNQQPARIMENNFCPTTEVLTDAYSVNRFCSPTEDIGLLNIPSIYETMSNACFEETREKPFDGGWSWPTDRGATMCTGNESETRQCESFDADEDEDEQNTDISEDAPREPLKRVRRQRANDRERRRMKSLNGALNNLKRCIPLPKTKRRVTKLEILRIACNYIQTLYDALNGGNERHSEHLGALGGSQHHIINGMSVTQRLSLLSNNLKFQFQL